MCDYKKYLDEGIYCINKGEIKKAIDLITQSIDLKNDWEISYFYRAVAYHSIEKYDEAILDYTKAIELNEKMTDAYYNRAKIILSRKDIKNPDITRAVNDLEKALELDEKFLDALYAMAAAHKKLGNYQKAIEYLDKLIKLEPDAVNARALKKLINQKYL